MVMLTKLKTKKDEQTAVKEKPTKKIALFDLTVSPKVFQQYNTRIDRTVPKQLDLLTPKNFVFKAKSKKRLSVLKKKILLERLRRQIEQNAAKAVSNSEYTVDSGVDDGILTHIFIVDFVFIEDLEDEDEKMEVVSNLKDMLAPFESLYSLEITRKYLSGSDVCVVTAGFKLSSEASSAVAAINGLLFSGVAIRACLSSELSSLFSSPSTITASSVPIHSSSRPGRAILHLENMLAPQDVSDPEEAEEVLHDLNLLCGGYAGLKSCWIEKRRVRGEPCTSVVDDTTQYAKYLSRLGDPDNVMFVEFATLLDALHAQTILKSLSYVTELCDTSMYRQGMFKSIVIADDFCQGIRLGGLVEVDSVTDEDERAEIVSDVVHLVQTSCHSAVEVTRVLFVPSEVSGLMDAVVGVGSIVVSAEVSLRLRQRVVGGTRLAVDVIQFKTMEEVSSLSSEDASLGQVLFSEQLTFQVIDTSASAMAVLSVHPPSGGSVKPNKRELLNLIHTVSPVVRVSDPAQHAQYLIECDPDQQCVVACVEFSDLSGAEEALLSLEGTVIGGHSVMAYLYYVTESEAGPEEGTAAAAAAAAAADSSFGSVSATAMPEQFSTREVVMQCEVASECLYYELITPAPPNAGLTSDASTNEVANNEGDISDARPVSKYTTAKIAPKLEMHSAGKMTFKTADEAVNGYVKELLTMISNFQAKAKEKNPNLPKQKLRFMAGIKQSLQAVKGNLAKLILVAPNTEASEALDDKIDLLLSEAQARGVPILYCLSKRTLGKAVQLTMKQTVVTVMDPNGAYELFKKILQFINALN